MRGERRLLRLGEFLVRRACRRLPPDIRDERYREWAAELPAILHDPQIRPAPRRAVRMLAYAADTLRGTRLAHIRAQGRRPAAASALGLYILLCLANVAWNTWSVVRAPEHGPGYLWLTLSLLILARPVSVLVGSAERVNKLIAIGGLSVGVAANLWSAAQPPGDWVNYLAAALFILLALAWGLTVLSARIKRALTWPRDN